MDLLKRQYRKAEQDIVEISSGKFDDNMERFDAEIDMYESKSSLSIMQLTISLQGIQAKGGEEKETRNLAQGARRKNQ